MLQAVRRHLRNGYIILRSRGAVALFGAAMREVAKILDSPVGPFLAPRDVWNDGLALARSEGWRCAVASVFRQVAAIYDPPVGSSRNPVNAGVREHAVRYHHTYELTKPDGVVPSRRPANDVDFALEAPFRFAPKIERAEPVAAVIHAYYLDALADMLAAVARIPAPVDLFLSTDTVEKRAEIARLCANWRKGAVEIRVLPNRGRDIGAKFVGFRDVYDRYDLFVHLHTKKSLHGGAPLARWRDYLVGALLGSDEIAASILSLFDDPRLGIVFPQHLYEIRGILNWGYDYPHARALAQRIGVEIDKNMVLEFPSGSMFWGRSAAIRPLLDCGLSYDDFPEESGQVDGTIAHAIERIVLIAAESRGFEWLKVVQRAHYPLQRAVLPIAAPQDVAAARLKVFQPCLTSVDVAWPAYAQFMQEARPLVSYPSRAGRPRATLIVPTVNPTQTFGGVATALEAFRQWADALGDGYDRRIVVTDAAIEPEGYASLSDYHAAAFVAGMDDAARILVDASEREGGRLEIRDREIFVATAWWTAGFARALEKDRARYFGGRRPFVYLIQDDEPNFYGWSSKYALAEATYRHGEDTIAVINSEELFDSMTAKYRFAETFRLPYRMNERIRAAMVARPRERLILVYGRPAVLRNCFELICAALHLWQQRDPIRASRWQVAFLGEAFEPELLGPIQNARVDGKVSLDAYADYLSRASVGVSLMLSPHPSYPPLEMAEAGVLTITNSFEGKDLRRRYADLISLDAPTPESLAAAIEQAVAAREPTVGEILPQPTAPEPLSVADGESDLRRLRELLARALA